MSENEHNNGEETAAGGAQWTDQKWPPFKSGEATDDGGDGPEAAEGGEPEKDADYYREHTDEIGDFAQHLIALRGGAKGLADGAKWDKGQMAHVDESGAPREHAHLVHYLKENPDQLDRFVEESQNLEKFINYLNSHPEELGNFVQELIRLRGGEEGIKKGEWDNEQVTHADPDGTPRDWAHLVGYIKRNPNELGRFVSEYMRLKDAEDAASPEEEPAKAAAGGGEGEKPGDDGAGEADGEEPDGDKPAEEEPDEKKADGEEPDGEKPAEGGDGDGSAEGDGEGAKEDDTKPEESDEDKADREAYEEWLERTKERDTPIDAKDYDSIGEMEENESHRAKSDYVEDFHPRFSGETDDVYYKRLKWEQMIREKSEEVPRFQYMKDGEYPEGVDHAAYDEYRKKHKGDGKNETDAEWLKRVGLPSLAEFLGNAVAKSDSESDTGEDAPGPGTKKWSEMSVAEKEAIIQKYPRRKGEKTAEWAKRLGIFGVAEGESKDSKEKEISREDMLKALDNTDAKDWLKKRYNMSEEDLLAMDDEKLRALYDEYMGRKKESDESKEKELSREQILKALDTTEAKDWLKKRYNMSEEDLLAMDDEQLKALYKAWLERNKKDKEKEEDDPKPPVGPVPPEGTGESEEVDDPLVMARIDRTADARAAAHDIAERMLSERINQGGVVRRFIQRAIIGNLFREGAIRRYEHRAYEMIRAKQSGAEVKEVDDKKWAVKSGLERFVTAYVNGYEDEMIHSKAGESMEVFKIEKDENGNEIVVRYYSENGERKNEKVESGAMHDATLKMRDAVRAYAQGGSRSEFEQAMGDLQEELRMQGEDPNKLMADNYIAVAEAARARFEHGKGIDDVMAGFAFINGEARSNVRTEAHRDALDKITDRLSNSIVGRVLPPEVIGTAASLAVRFGRSGVRNALIMGGSAIVGTALAPVLVPVVAGMALATVTSMGKERNRVTGDRATQARRLAQNETRGDEAYDEHVSETQYTLHSAEKLTSDLETALEEGDEEKLISALAIADTAARLSDERRIDLIQYSSADTDEIEAQRIKMDTARAKARAELHRRGIEPSKLDEAVRETTEMFENDISAKDRAFRSLRRRRMVAQGARAAVTAGVMSIASQEVVSLFRPDQVGVLENMGVQIQQNNMDASNTLLAGAFGFRGVERVNALVQQGADLTQQQIDELRAKGYVVTQGTPKVVESTQEVPMSQYMETNENARVSNYFGNGTSGSDHNELGGVYNAGQGELRGPWMRLHGDSWNGSMRVNVHDMNEGNVGFLVTIDGKKILYPAVAGDKLGVFYPDYSKMDSTMETIFRERLFDRVQGVYMPGTSTNGLTDCISIWGYNGSGRVPETITSTVRTLKETWDVTGAETSTFVRDIAGFPLIGVAPRRNLTLGKQADSHKPNGTGGAPGTHRAQPHTEERWTGMYEGPDGRMHPSSDYRPPRDGSVPPAGPPAGEPAPAPAEEAPAEEAPAAPAAAGGGETGSPNIKEESAEEETVPYYDPIRFDSEDMTMNPTDDQIKKSAEKNGLTVSDEDMRTIKAAMERWNNIGKDFRVHLLDGKRKVAHRVITDYGVDTTDAVLNQEAAEVLLKFGLAVKEPEIEPESEMLEEDEAAAA